jgi:tetratricopeptide (TPR) repeat protein
LAYLIWAGVVGRTLTPLRDGIPLLGKPGKDKFGYPTQHVDQALLRSLLYHGRFERLDAAFAHYQDAFEKDPRFEYWPIDAGNAFGSAEPALDPQLDAWVAVSPAHFAPYLARGFHRLNVGWAMRGGKYANKTPEENFILMQQHLTKALADFDRALAIRPRLIAAMRGRIQVLNPMGDDAGRAQAIAQATEACPACFQVRVTALMALEPRWGGSYEAMGKLALAAQAEKNPRFRLLPGYIELDQADRLHDEKRDDEALAAVNKACAFGDHWEFLNERALVRYLRKEYDAALADLDRADALRPGLPDVLYLRADVKYRLKRTEEAAQDLLAALRVEPTHFRAAKMVERVRQGLMVQGWEHAQARRMADAVRLYDLALELDASHKEAEQRRTIILAGGRRPDAARVAEMEALFAKHPDDPLVIRQLDYALALGQGNFQRPSELWTAYLARHPDDGRALIERAGAYKNLGRLPEARADARRACELGFSEACAILGRI